MGSAQSRRRKHKPLASPSGAPTRQENTKLHASPQESQPSQPSPQHSTATKRPLVLDNGSWSLKAGVAGEEAPRVSCRLPYTDHPIQRGEITNWHHMEQLWRHAFHDQLHVAPEEHPVLLTEAPSNSRSDRERMAEVMFESFNIPSMYVAVQGVLALYISGRTTGITLDVGHGFSHAVPMFEGQVQPHAMVHTPIAGCDVTEHLATLLSVTTDTARDVKEKMARVALDEDDHLGGKEQEHVLPDGHVITVGGQRSRCAEALFQPSVIGALSQQQVGVHQLLYNATAACDQGMRPQLFGNILLSGGTSLLPGFPQRVYKELKELTPSACKVVIVAPPQRRHCVWMGGSILASLSSFDRMWFSQQQYHEIGPSVVHRR